MSLRILYHSLSPILKPEPIFSRQTLRSARQITSSKNELAFALVCSDQNLQAALLIIWVKIRKHELQKRSCSSKWTQLHLLHTTIGRPLPFLEKLPIEVRNEIYKLLLVNPLLGQPAGLTKLSSGDYPKYYLHLAILRTCQSILDEASSVLYGNNLFCVLCLDEDAPTSYHQIDLRSSYLSCPVTRRWEWKSYCRNKSKFLEEYQIADKVRQ